MTTAELLNRTENKELESRQMNTAGDVSVNEPLFAQAARLGRTEPLTIRDDEFGAFSGHSGAGV